MEITVRKNESAGRYEALTEDGTVAGYADYLEQGGSLIFPHTVTDPQFRGQGIAAQVATYALDDARTAGKSVVPQCSYFADFIDEHSEYADLVAR